MKDISGSEGDCRIGRQARAGAESGSGRYTTPEQRVGAEVGGERILPQESVCERDYCKHHLCRCSLLRLLRFSK
jgi:hypothetical protein